MLVIPSRKPDRRRFADFGVVTQACCAFAIPTAEGGLRDLENPEAAEMLIRSAHKNGANVLPPVGGWNCNGIPLENVFMEAAADNARLTGSWRASLPCAGNTALTGWTWTGNIPGGR